MKASKTHFSDFAEIGGPLRGQVVVLTGDSVLALVLSISQQIHSMSHWLFVVVEVMLFKQHQLFIEQ
jgi:hypothetical protein